MSLSIDAANVPVIDIAGFEQGDGPRAQAVARAVDRALVDIGFFVVVGHDVPAGGVAATAATCRRFFDLPLADKQAVANHGTPFRGYVGYGGENLSYTEGEATPADWKESFIMGRPDLGDPYFRREDLAGTFKTNVWPSTMPDLRPAMEWYYDRMAALNETLMRALALALDLPADWFSDKLDRHDSTLRAANYPHQDRPPRPGQLRAGAHTDYGAITILAVEEAPGGLQVRTRAGHWVDAPVVPGGFVVNVGDLMMTWTNDRWLSNLHRVVNPPPDADGSTRRQSLVYFVNCNPDALIECLPTCRDAEHPPRHEPITAGEHRRIKIARSATPPIG